MFSLFPRRNRGLKLSGRENQDIRYLTHCCRRTIVAIGECPQPLLEDILQLASENATILSALLALSARQRLSDEDHAHPNHPARGLAPHAQHSLSCWEALDWYQATITKVRATLSRLQTLGSHVSCGDAVEVLCSCELLALFGFPEKVHNWSVHVRGMIAFIESLDLELFRTVPLVRNARTIAAYWDISAFALNRPEMSQHTWLRWGICPLPRGQGDEFAGDAPAAFSPFEVTTGYPETLITVIALVSAVMEDVHGAGTVVDEWIACCIQDLLRNTGRGDETLSADDHDSVSLQDCPVSYWTSRMHVIIAEWEPPAIPPHISTTLSLALTNAWEIIRKAAHIYLTRGGFATSVYTPRSIQRERINRRFVREMIFGLQSLISLAEEQEITIANAMIWPMTVIGNEICDDRSLQRELVALFHRLQKYFRIAHFNQVLELLVELWQRFADSTSLVDSMEPPAALSLQILAAEKDLSVPLF
ncbi:hypothetical protein BO79DRAFT_248215 [Aspergillus costaricaensis CBS 115574]|uniref:Uncharacterized protein n=1 Tax=Aspergillus costaricaensis CBS 115574 TaxID=1448317 RepID=A0ACD1I1L8_9EURO|nr:hypothetical protein BO79DRAFT_248215 [Aspergillus costaricaensis CBS 115574]RAK84387.1 hypothetical protein BO79DRAFT_248215 [Aspergillus costaricaensis CBS 115574]